MKTELNKKVLEGHRGALVELEEQGRGAASTRSPLRSAVNGGGPGERDHHTAIRWHSLLHLSSLRPPPALP